MLLVKLAVWQQLSLRFIRLKLGLYLLAPMQLFSSVVIQSLNILHFELSSKGLGDKRQYVDPSRIKPYGATSWPDSSSA